MIARSGGKISAPGKRIRVLGEGVEAQKVGSSTLPRLRRVLAMARSSTCTLLLLLLMVSMGVLWPAVTKASQPPGASSEGQSPSTEMARLVTDLSSPDKAVQRAAVIALGKLGDPRVLSLLEALRGGSFYVWRQPSGGRETVIAREHTTRDGKEVVSIVRADNEELIQSDDGQVIYVETSALEAIWPDRRLRRIMKPIIDELRSRVNLFDLDPNARRSAATRLGSLGRPELIPLLEEALSKEPTWWIRNAIHEAINLIKLDDDSPEVRREAAVRLGELRAETALSALQRLVEASAGGDSATSDGSVQRAAEVAIEQIERWEGITRVVGTLFRGLSLSSILLLMALGLAVTFGLMGVINMAHGELMMLGAYSAFVMQGWFQTYLPANLFDYYFLLAIPFSFVVAGAMGLVMERSVIRFLYGRPLDTLLVTWGVSLILQQAIRLIFGAANVNVTAPGWLRGGLQAMVGLQLPYNRLFIIVLALASLVGTYLLLFHSKPGLRVRAVTQNREMSACLGIPARKVDTYTFALGSGLAGMAGCALSTVGNVGPDLGQNYIVDSFMVVVAGGVGKLAGTLAAAFGIGGLNKLLEPSFGAVFGKVLIVVLVILFLQWKPSGLFPAKGRLAEY